jgi:hypothetical protein
MKLGIFHKEMASSFHELLFGVLSGYLLLSASLYKSGIHEVALITL